MMPNETIQMERSTPPGRGRGSLSLANEMFPALREHKQFATLHKGRRDVPLGNNELISDHGEYAEGCHAQFTARVHRVAYTTVGGLCDREAQECGYKSVQDILDKLGQWDRSFDQNSIVTLAYFS